MKIGVVGTGAIGGFFAARLAHAGEDVTIVDRGGTLAAIAANGLTLVEPQGSINVKVKTVPSPAEIGKQDAVFLCVKAYQLPHVAKELLTHDVEMIVTAQNGIPWWYFFKDEGPFAGRRLESVDPGGVIADHIPTDRVVGCVVYPSAAVLSPGVVKHGKNERVSVAELDGEKTDRVKRLSNTLRKAGFKAPVVSNLRAEIWTKLWGNLSFNPISALTQATLEEMCRFPPTRCLAEAIMDEMQMVAEALGIHIPISRDQRLAASEAMGVHKTSMLQDIEKGRPTEADALIASTSEIGKLVGVATPHVNAMYALVTLLTKTLADRKDPSHSPAKGGGSP
jgi:2-dehydropantoate 2-reductase